MGAHIVHHCHHVGIERLQLQLLPQNGEYQLHKQRLLVRLERCAVFAGSLQQTQQPLYLRRETIHNLLRKLRTLLCKKIDADIFGLQLGGPSTHPMAAGKIKHGISGRNFGHSSVNQIGKRTGQHERQVIIIGEIVKCSVFPKIMCEIPHPEPFFR